MAPISMILGGLCVLLAIITISLVFKVKKLKTGMFHLHHFIIQGIIIAYNYCMLSYFCVLLFSCEWCCAARDTRGKPIIDWNTALWFFKVRIKYRMSMLKPKLKTIIIIIIICNYMYYNNIKQKMSMCTSFFCSRSNSSISIWSERQIRFSKTYIS